MSRTIPPKASLTISDKEAAMNSTQQGKLIYTEYHGHPGAFLIRNDRPTVVSFLSDSKIGNIYIAKVKNIVKNLDACFVEIADREICFLPLRNAADPYLINRTYDGVLKQGDELPVQIIRDAQKTKQATVTADRKVFPASLLPKISHAACFSVIYENDVNRLPQTEELISPKEYSEIITDDPRVYHILQTNACGVPIRLYEDRFLSLNKLYAIDSKAEMALERRIWLKSGAYLIIEPTEALTVIDVNTGKYESKRDIGDETAVKINREAAEECALQLRLRNLSGIIIIDFINMKEQENRQALLQYMRDLVANDSMTVRVIDLTPLGLMELTRKKVAKPVHEQVVQWRNR